MPTPNERTVTAQDIIDKLHGMHCVFGVGFDEAKKDIDALLSRARQEARREALKEMDEAHRIEYREIEDLVPFEEMTVNKLRQEYQQPN